MYSTSSMMNAEAQTCIHHIKWSYSWFKLLDFCGFTPFWIFQILVTRTLSAGTEISQVSLMHVMKVNKNDDE